MSLKTPLGRVLGLGSAKEGTDHWWAQRVSAVALIFLGGWFVFSLLRLESLTYLDVIRFVGVPLNAVLLSLLSLTLAYSDKRSWPIELGLAGAAANNPPYADDFGEEPF